MGVWHCQAPDVAVWMFWTPGEDQDAHQEPDYDLWCLFYRWILIWNSTINITLWRRLFPMSWDIMVRFWRRFLSFKIYYFASILVYNKRNILIWKLGINVRIKDISNFLLQKENLETVLPWQRTRKSLTFCIFLMKLQKYPVFRLDLILHEHIENL